MKVTVEYTRKEYVTAEVLIDDAEWKEYWDEVLDAEPGAQVSPAWVKEFLESDDSWETCRIPGTLEVLGDDAAEIDRVEL